MFNSIKKFFSKEVNVPKKHDLYMFRKNAANPWAKPDLVVIDVKDGWVLSKWVDEHGTPYYGQTPFADELKFFNRIYMKYENKTAIS